MSSLSLRFTVERGLLRLGPAWALLAGAALGWAEMAAAGEESSPLSFLALLLLALALVEPIWGGVWAQTAALGHSLAGIQPPPAPPPWPYARAQAPLARLWRWLRDGEAPSSGGLGLVATLLAMAGVTALMALLHPAGGRAALASSLVVIFLALMGAALQPAFAATTRLLAAVVGVALPWLLGLGLWAWQPPPPLIWLLIGAFTLLAFAEETGAENSRRRLTAAAGYGIIIGALLWAQQPLAAGLEAVICAVPAWRWLHGRTDGVARWHLLALAAATLAVAAL